MKCMSFDNTGTILSIPNVWMPKLERNKDSQVKPT